MAVSVVRAARRRVLVARGGASSQWYDDVYASHDHYATHYKESRYLPVWEALCDRIPDSSSVLEVGCGTGQLAEMMLDRGAGSYTGFDFSPKAVELARERLPHCRIEVADARSTDLYTAQPYDVVVTTEVLEHITDDLQVLERVPSGVQILATVPDFPYESHVRWFDTAEQVRARYEPYFESLEITTYHHAGDTEGRGGTFYLMNGPRR
jgi:trans-aconitate methyltransferase